MILKRLNLPRNFPQHYARKIAKAAGKSLLAHATLKNMWASRNIAAMAKPKRPSRGCLNVSRGSIDENAECGLQL